MALKRTQRFAVAIAGAGLAMGLVAGCSSDDSSSSSASSSTAATSTAAESSASNGGASADPAADLVGSGCASYAAANASGPGSVGGMALDPVATAASNNPLLKTLTAAVSGKLNPQVNLVDTLNGSQFTVFAPVDEAFAKVPAATIDTLKTDSALLTKILTYHVIPGQLSPSQIAGTHKTVEGQDVTVSGSGNDLKVGSGNASVICGGVKTANATVYLIDSVLMPPS
ncbi:fasciclin domain-containing protein [Williamsia deligens]|uniref:Fasciclin domain-containing protein n=1 Tax=Williamsia deligens TaxID=321325 RepID=A0ABW3G4W8_9NOCA|nr:fasciclin domain-containing protein [Williamsia deligens]MCP2193605.1 Uncaracterized surface protein containing fasciclin (FAS1) repeats [Williamsia deligens]